VAWQRLGDPCCATQELLRATLPQHSQNSIQVSPQTALGESIHLHGLSTSALKELLNTCCHPSKSSAGPHSPKYPGREGNVKVNREFLAEGQTAVQQTRFDPGCVSNATPAREATPPCPVSGWLKNLKNLLNHVQKPQGVLGLW